MTASLTIPGVAPIGVFPFLGGGGDYLAYVDPALTPWVSWMGGKRRMAREVLSTVGLQVGGNGPAVLGDACWWGWVWPTCLHPSTGPEVCRVLRSWQGQDPRALWFRLRDMGPILDNRPAAAAQLLWLQARAASGVPVWWEGLESGQWVSTKIDRAGQRQATEPELLAASGDGRRRQRAYERGLVKGKSAGGAPEVAWQTGGGLVQMDGHGRGPYPAWMATGKPKLRASDGRGVERESGQRTTRAERLVATTRGDQVPGAPYEAGHKGRGNRGGGGIVNPATIANRIDATRARIRPDVVIEHMDAMELTERWASRLGSRARVVLDPPYQGKTGYPATCPRDRVLRVAELWARAGARVVLNEAVGLAGELGPGWSHHELRHAPKPEWITTYRCDTSAVLPPLLRRATA